MAAALQCRRIQNRLPDRTGNIVLTKKPLTLAPGYVIQDLSPTGRLIQRIDFIVKLDPEYGSQGIWDFELLHECRTHGIQAILDLPL
jgi:hypothetical protein